MKVMHMVQPEAVAMMMVLRPVSGTRMSSVSSWIAPVALWALGSQRELFVSLKLKKLLFKQSLNSKPKTIANF